MTFVQWICNEEKKLCKQVVTSQWFKFLNVAGVHISLIFSNVDQATISSQKKVMMTLPRQNSPETGLNNSTFVQVSQSELGHKHMICNGYYIPHNTGKQEISATNQISDKALTLLILMHVNIFNCLIMPKCKANTM